MKFLVAFVVSVAFATAALAIEAGDPFSTGDSWGPHMPNGTPAPAPSDQSPND